MSARKVCFVTDELYPFTAGGIGRLTHNLIRASSGSGIEFHVVFPDYCAFTPAEVCKHFGPSVHAHQAPLRQGWSSTTEHGAIYAPAASYTDTSWHAQSVDLMRMLKQLERSGIRFDTIEFADYRGWAFCTIQEKLLGGAFAHSEIAIRLHSTDGVLQHVEPRTPTVEQLGRFELERKALLDADRIIAHLPAVPEFNARYYGFGPEWLNKVTIEFPPVVETPTAVLPTRAAAQRDLVFLTKIQACKRPDLFVRGAAMFMRQVPGFTGRAVLSCHRGDPAYFERVQKMVPADLAHRFVFEAPGPNRDALMRSGIVVIASDYESLNLTAYETTDAGGTLVLNERCIAFGDRTPFVDGTNCFKFDGTVHGLASALERAWSSPAPERVTWTVDAPYWEQPSPSPLHPSTARSGRVSVLITNYNLAMHLPETLASIAASTYEDIEVIVVDDCSPNAFDQHVMERLQQEPPSDIPPVRVIRNPVNRGLPASRNIGLDAASGEFVLPLDADDCISPTFIELAVKALNRHREFDVVVPSTGYFRTDDDLAANRFCDWAMFLGDAPSLGMVFNRTSCATSLMRRSLFERHRYNEVLTSYEDWDLYQRLVLSGVRFLVTNEVHFFYRQRPGSMIKGVSRARHYELLARMYEGYPSPLPPSVRQFAMLGPSAALDAALEAERATLAAITGEPPLRHQVVDALNAALKSTPLLHPVLKRVVAEAKKLRS